MRQFRRRKNGNDDRRGEKGGEEEIGRGESALLSWVELKISSVTHTDAGAGNSGNAASRRGAACHVGLTLVVIVRQNLEIELGHHHYARKTATTFTSYVAP